MKLTELVEALVATKATPETILAAVRVAEAQRDAEIEASKQKARDRMQRYKESHPEKNVAKRSGTSTNVEQRLTGGDAHVEDKPLPTEIEPQAKKQNTRSADADAFKAALSDLDPEHLAALIEHRRRKRAAMTAKAARMFRDDAAKCGLTLAEAVDTCIRRNWVALEPSWLPGARAGPKPNPALAAADALLEKMHAARNQTEPDPTYPRLVAFSGSG